MKKSFLVYQDWEEVFNCLTDSQTGKLLKAMLLHARGETPVLNEKLSLIFVQFRQQLDRNIQNWEKVSKINKSNIKARWSKAKKDTTVYDRNTNVDVKVKVKDKVKDISIEREKFIKYIKTLKADEEFKDKDIDLELKKFKDYLLSKGKKYKDYSAGFRNWLRRSDDFKYTVKKESPKGDNERMLEKLYAE